MESILEFFVFVLYLYCGWRFKYQSGMTDWTNNNQKEKVSDYIRNGPMYVLYTEEEIRGIQG